MPQISSHCWVCWNNEPIKIRIMGKLQNGGCSYSLWHILLCCEVARRNQFPQCSCLKLKTTAGVRNLVVCNMCGDLYCWDLDCWGKTYCWRRSLFINSASVHFKAEGLAANGLITNSAAQLFLFYLSHKTSVSCSNLTNVFKYFINLHFSHCSVFYRLTGPTRKLVL